MENAKKIYEEQIYGHWRSGEKVTYEVQEKSSRVNPPEDNPFAAMFRLSTTDDGVDVKLHIEAEGRKVSFIVRAYKPAPEAAKRFRDGAPFIVCMHPIQPLAFVREQGYGAVFLDTAMVAEDNCHRRGCFYDLYPYTEEPALQTGELMAWAWAAAKVLDAMEAGLAKDLGFHPEKSIVTGVSRWGKATAVCGAFEKRFRMTVPVCSGAGGLALWKVNSEGTVCDMSFCGGPTEYVYTKNEPLDCLQSDAERGWFVDNFLKFKSYAEIPVEQHELTVLAASKYRQYVIVAAWTGEDWVNAPAMWQCYLQARDAYRELGLEDNISAHFHREGHAVLEEDLEHIFAEFEKPIVWGRV